MARPKSVKKPAARPPLAAQPEQRNRLWWALGLAALIAVGGLAAWAFWPLDLEKWQGLELAHKGRTAEAEPHLLNALERRPNDVELIRALALGKLGSNRAAEAEPFLSRWCELRPRDAEPFRRRMEFRLQQHNFPQALEDGRHVLELEPDNAEVGRQVAPALLITGQLEEAERECRHWLGRMPDDPTLIYLLADVCHQRGNNTESEAVLDRYLASGPPSPAALLLRAILYAEADQPEQAIPLLRKVLESRPPPWQQLAASYQLSLALARTGHGEDALQVAAQVQWHQAVDLMGRREHPKVPGLLLWVAEALLGVGRTTESVDLLGKILAQDPNCAPEAVRLLEKAVAKEPKCFPAHCLLADFYDKQGQPVKAAEHRRRAKP